MNLEMEENDFIPVPEKAEADLKCTINANSFWDRIVQRAIFHEVGYINIVNANLRFGLDLLNNGGDVPMAVRDNMGFEKPIQLMDDRFRYDRDAESEGSAPHKIQVNFPSNQRDLLLDTANACGIDLEEITGRIVIAGLDAMEQKDTGGSRIVKFEKGKRSLYEFAINRPTEKVYREALKLNEQKRLEGPKNQTE